MFPLDYPGDNYEFPHFKDVVNVSANHLKENVPFIELYKAELYCIENVEVRKIEKEKIESEICLVLQKLLFLQVAGKFRKYFWYESTIFNEKLRIRRLQCPPQYTVFFQDIKVDKRKWTDICLHSLKQSQTSLWYKERFLRITSSRRAHRIKTIIDRVVMKVWRSSL